MTNMSSGEQAERAGDQVVGPSCAKASAAARLEPRIAEVCGQLNVLFAELSRLVAEAESTGAWQGAGVRSLAHWVTWKTGLSSSNARSVVHAAESRVSHPAITERFDDGRLSLDQATVAMDCEPVDDAEFAHLATVMTIPQMRLALRAAKPRDPKPPAADSESVSIGHDRDGHWTCKVALHPDRGAIVEAALAEARDDLFREGRENVTWADALVEVAMRSLDASAAARRDRFRINLFIDPTQDLPATWTNGVAVPDAIRDLLSCDGTVTPTFVANGHPISVGRTQRIVPDRTRRHVEHRDKKCRVPWCTNERWLEVHHIVHWTAGGPTDMANLVALCGACHRQHHLGLLGIRGDAEEPDGLVFTDETGKPIDPATRPSRPTGPSPRPRHRYVHPLGERMRRDALCFDPRRRHRSPTATATT